MAGLAGLGAAACLAACGSGSGSTSVGQSPHGGGAGADFHQSNIVISLSCTPAAAGAGASIQVDGWDPQSWHRKAHAEFTLPASVLTAQPTDGQPGHTGGVYDLCNAGRRELTDSDLYGSRVQPADSVIVSRVRPIFDQDFTKIAVVIRDENTKATHVGYVDRSGKLTDLTDLTGSADGFGVTPYEQNPVFAPDGSSVWFTYPDPQDQDVTHIASRPLAGDHKLVDQWHGDGNRLLTLSLVGTPVRGLLADAVHVSPDGRRMAAWANVSGAVFDIPARTGRLTKETAVHPVSLQPKGPTTCSDVIGWTDNHTVLCAGGNSASSYDIFVTQDVDTPTAPTSAAILPANDRQNFAQVISPDGKQFVFVSQQGDVKSFYVSATTPGSTPAKVEPSADFTLPDTAIMVDWR
jgi:hypothetical protein